MHRIHLWSSSGDSFPLFMGHVPPTMPLSWDGWGWLVLSTSSLRVSILETLLHAPRPIVPRDDPHLPLPLRFSDPESQRRSSPSHRGGEPSRSLPPGWPSDLLPGLEPDRPWVCSRIEPDSLRVRSGPSSLSQGQGREEGTRGREVHRCGCAWPSRSTARARPHLAERGRGKGAGTGGGTTGNAGGKNAREEGPCTP